MGIASFQKVRILQRGDAVGGCAMFLRFATLAVVRTVGVTVM